MKNKPKSDNASTVVMVSVACVRVTNPRDRDRRKFEQILRSIAELGLKRPITVTKCGLGKNGQPVYDLICGQGRLEAFKALGQLEIPAIVRCMSKTEGLVASLVENIARRRIRPIEQIKLIQWMRDQGNSLDDISLKTGLSSHYLQGILNLLDKGEDRVLDAVLHGRLPITIAAQIVTVDADGAQRLLMDAYEKKAMKQTTLSAFRRILEQRQCFGKSYANDAKIHGKRRTTAEGLIAAYKQETQRQKLLIRKARICESRLLAIVAAFKALFTDENFITLLRAEDLETLPKFLAERIQRS